MPAVVLSAVLAAAPPEVRGVRVDRAPLASRDSIRRTLDLKEANFNAVFVNVWSRGYPLWRSEVFARHTGLETDPVYGSRDVLAEVIEEADARGLAVIPWVEYGFVIGFTGGRAPLVEAHTEWFAKRKDGSFEFSWAGTTRSYWIAHSHPEGQQFLFELLTELAARYPVPRSSSTVPGSPNSTAATTRRRRPSTPPNTMAPSLRRTSAIPPGCAGGRTN